MTRVTHLLLFGIAAYFLVLVFTLPAVHLENYIEERMPGLSLSAVSGSVFNGRAGRVEYNDMALGEMHWRFKPLALLAGQLGYNLKFSSSAGPGKAVAGVTFAGTLFGRDIDLTLFPDQVVNMYMPLGVETSGAINILVDTMKLTKTFPSGISGKAVWDSAAVLAPLELVLGDIFMNFQSNGDEIVGSIENASDYGLSGEIAIAPGNTYRVDLVILPDAGVSRDTISILENVATAEAGGRYRLRSSGQW